jgi:Glycosyl transferase family 11
MVCIVRLKGGLGNQLFQYAFGRAAALKYGSTLLLDTRLLSTKDPTITPREYALGPFRIAAGLLADSQARQFGARTSRIGLWLARRGVGGRDCKYVLERGLSYDATALDDVKSNAIFEGYWQSEKYFLQFAAPIREELSITESPALRLACDDVAGEESVSVHVRRGDYVENAGASAMHGVCPLSYYEACFDHIESVVRKPRYYLFTDDPEWAKKSRGFFSREMTVVSQRARLLPHEELVLMSRCRHHILANSSFSWWGAWLDGRLDGVVVAPIRWFKSDIDTTDLLPTRWRRL